MTIKKGEPWGTAVVRPGSLPLASDDRAVAEFDGEVTGVVGGDLWRVLGEPAPKSPGEEGTAVPIDRMEVLVTRRGRTDRVMAVSHVRVGRWFSRGRLVVATNLGQWRRWVVAPRAHPNDGHLHVMTLEPRMTSRERLIARRRAVAGVHVPHPFIGIEKCEETTIERRGAEPLFVDGRRFRGWSAVRVRVLSDDLTVVI